jgi:hypothetical protein
MRGDTMYKTKKRLLTVIAAILFISLLMFTGCNNKNTILLNEGVLKSSEAWPKEDLSKIILYQGDNFIQPDVSWEPYKVSRIVKGIYMTGHSVGLTERFNNILTLTGKTEINAWVIDVKDDYGTLTYKSSIPMAKEVGADRTVKVRDFHTIMETLRDHDIYPIARIVTFKDKHAASARPDLAIKTNTGQVWRDRKGDAWLNPYNRESWDYLIDIGKEAAAKGFKEIQFDYVRFPTDGNRAIIDYGKAGKEEKMADAIAAFLQYARDELRDYGVYVSADIFGLVPTVVDDMGLGQHLETLTTAADILCPMVYPSHYALGTFGAQIPDKEPYKIVNTSMTAAKKRINDLETKEQKAILRPWLQDFTASYLGAGYYKAYGPNEVRDQIKATYDAGIEEWILWNAGNRYSWDGIEAN